MEVILPENPKTTQSKKTACAIPLVFAPLLHCTNKDSPRKTLTSSLVSHSSSRFSFDSRCCRLSSTECETVVQTQLWCKKKQNKLCGFNEFSVHWIFIPKELSRKKRGVFSHLLTRVVVQGLAGSWGWASALLSWEVFSITSVHRHRPLLWGPRKETLWAHQQNWWAPYVAYRPFGERLVHKHKALCLRGLVGFYPFALAIPLQMNDHHHHYHFSTQFGPSGSYRICVDVAGGLPQSQKMCSCLHRAWRFLLHSFSSSAPFPLVAESLVRHHKLHSKSWGRPH